MALPKLKRNEAVLLAILALGGGGYFYSTSLVIPRYNAYLAERDRTTALLTDLERAKLAARQKVQWEEATRSALAVSDSLPLPKSSDLAAFLKDLSDEARAAGTKLTALVPQASTPEGDDFVRIPLALSFRGTFGKTLAFLDAVRTGNHVFVMTDARFAPTEVDKVSELQVDITAYTLLKKSEVAGVAQPQPQPQQ